MSESPGLNLDWPEKVDKGYRFCVLAGFFIYLFFKGLVSEGLEDAEKEARGQDGTRGLICQIQEVQRRDHISTMSALKNTFEL